MDESQDSPRLRRFATYNMWNLFRERRGDHLARYELVADVIRDMDVDVIALQEIIAPDVEAAASRLAQLAKMASMSAAVTPAWYCEDDAQDATYAVGAGGHGFCVGLMWRDADWIEPVPDSFRAYGPQDFWHALVKLTLRIDGYPITFASYHASPFGRNLRADQAERLLAALTRPPGPVLMGGDVNTVGASRVVGPDGRLSFYDPDPYADVEWFGDLVYQCDWRFEDDGRRVHWADRRPSDVLVSGGLHDVAATLNAPWQATAGHHPVCEFGQRGVQRRIDAVFATDDVVPVLRGYEVVDTAMTRVASDHLPVVVTLDPSAITDRPAPPAMSLPM